MDPESVAIIDRLARVETSLKHVLDALNEIRDELRHNDSKYVTRREYEDFRKDIEARRAPWWIIGGLLLSAGLGLFNILA